MEHYVNQRGESLDSRELPRPGVSKVLWLVAVSFGLLCILQSALNIALRLQGVGFCKGSDLAAVSPTPPAAFSILLQENRRLATDNRILREDNDFLAEENKILRDRLRKLTTRPPESKHKGCSPGWTQHASSCYQLSTEAGSWWHARDDCQARGANLVILNGTGVEEVLRALGSPAVWIGLKAERCRARNMDQPTWTWVDGTQLTDENRFRRPHNQHFLCAYSVLDRYNSVIWIQAACGDRNRWLCERTTSDSRPSPRLLLNVALCLSFVLFITVS